MILILPQYNLFLSDIRLKKCDKAADTCPFAFGSVPDLYKSQEMYDKVVFKEPFMLKYCLDRYKTQKICDKAVVFLPTLKFVSDWFVTNKMLEKSYVAFSNDDRVFANEDSDNATFFSDDISLNTIDLNINLDDANFDKDDLETIIHVRLMAWHNKYKRKACKREIN